MSKYGRFGKYGDKKRLEKLKGQKKPPKRTSATYKQDEHIKISPKHPGGGRK